MISLELCAFMGKNNGLTMLKYIKEDGTQLLQGMSTRKLWKKSRNMLQILGISPHPINLDGISKPLNEELTRLVLLVYI